METQTIFTQVVQHLARQRVAAAHPSGNCQYRTPDGKRCAVGYLVPEWYYNETLEGNTPRDREVANALTWAHGEFTNQQWEMLQELQLLHDREVDMLSYAQDLLPINRESDNSVSIRRDRLIQRVEWLAKTYEVIIPRAFYDWMAEVNDE